MFVCFFFCAAIPPSIAVSVPSEIDRSTYTLSDIYMVEVGREFQIQCISQGDFSGVVTWQIRNESGGKIIMSLFICITHFVMAHV